MPPILDLVHDSRLETRFADDGTTIHTFSEPNGVHRRIHREEYWKRERCLGHGGYGQVYLEKCIAGKRRGSIRAVKVIYGQSHSFKPMAFNRELEAITKFSHDRYNSWFVKSFGWYEDGSAIFITMEYCQYGDLHHYLSDTHFLPITQAQQLTLQILESLHQMHENGFAHRDLKPGNILIKARPPEDWWVVLADFGISKRAEDSNGPSTVKGTASFMAPELQGFVNPPRPDDTPDFKAGDMWALGEIAFRMLTGKPTFQTLQELLEFCRGERIYPSDRLPLTTGDDGKDFIANLMRIDSYDRMNTSDALNHRWMKLQHMDIEGNIAGLNLEQTNRQEFIRPDNIQDASAKWTTLSDAESVNATVQRRAAISSHSYQEDSRQTHFTQRYRPSPTLQNHKKSSETSFLRACVVLKGHKSHISYVVFSPDGERLASVSTSYNGGTVRLWDAYSGAAIRTIEGYKDGVRKVTFLSDGERLASVSYENTVRLWDARSGAAIRTIEGHKGHISDIAFSPDGKRLVSVSYENTVWLWDACSGAAIRTLEGHKGYISDIAFSPDGKRLASASTSYNDGTVRLWDAHSGAAIRTLEGYKDGISIVTFSPDGERLASALYYNDETVRLWDARSGAAIRTLEGHKNGVHKVTFSPDGERLASTSCNDGTVRLWDARSGAAIRILEGHKGYISDIAFSPNGKQLASASTSYNDGTVRLWDARSGAAIRTLEGYKDEISIVTFSPDGKRLASASYNDGTVRLWDARSGAVIQILEGYKNGVRIITFSPDGERLVAISCGDNTIRLWDARSGAAIRTLEGHKNLINDVAFSPDGERLASASYDKTVRLWDARS